MYYASLDGASPCASASAPNHFLTLPRHPNFAGAVPGAPGSHK
jgi:hypothetical protein